MAELRQIARELAGPLRAEQRRGYQDTAIIGQGIGEYSRAWAERAGKAARGTATQRQCARIASLLAGYADCAPLQRRERAQEALRLLEGLAGGKGRKPPSAAERSEGDGEEADAPTPYLDQTLATGRRRSAGWVRKLAKLGVETKRDLLYHFPRDYVPLKHIRDLKDGERAVVLADAGIREEAVVGERRGYRLMRYALEISDKSGKAWVTSFARVPRRGSRSRAILRSPLALGYPPGTRVLVEGNVRRAGRLIELQYGGSERVDRTDNLGPGMLVPVYPLTDGVYQGQVRPAVRSILEGLPEDLGDPLAERLRRRHKLCGLREALRDIHWPRSKRACEAARRRLAFEEFLVLQVALAQRKREMQRSGSGIAMPPRADPVAIFEEVLPFSLTRAQQRAIGEIVGDMASDTPMCRLVQGDVGSGKTVVAAAALMVALQNGYQGALMAPTELLAEQHYLVLSRMLAPFGVAVQLLTGSLRRKQREEAHARAADGRAQVTVGTHALIQEGVEFKGLGLVVVDEQHRFGVRQRAALRTKGWMPDMLVMTATPIPRTLAMTAYGDLDISVLDEMPPGRRPITTTWIPSQRQHEAYEFVRRQITEGRQAYVVCPLIEESESLQAEAATKLAEELGQGIFPEFAVGLLHGAMAVPEKDAAMQAFRSGEIDVLCATTVVEVGVDVPNATAMLILNAERFGLSQLHQLRGRVGRGALESHCILLSDGKYDPSGRLAPGVDDSLRLAQRRLRVMQEQPDGFAIAEEDLLLRGPGEFYGTRQHGMPDFRLARMVRDVGVLEEAREAAWSVIEQDPALAREEHAVLQAQVAALRERMDRAAG